MNIRELLARTKELYMEMDRCPERRQEIRNEVIELNIKLVPHILKKYKPYTDDMYQDGCMGLVKAAESYDASKRVPFANYACICIEREIQLSHKYEARRFEHKAVNDGILESLDEASTLINGDELTKSERVPDESATLAFEEILNDEALDGLFCNCIIPCIEELGEKGRSKSSIDVDLWKKLEVRYFMEMSQEESQRARITFTAMAELLGTKTQNTRTRHKKVLQAIQNKCVTMGYRNKVGEIDE